jgi:prepilin-type N-terminal cleavage/methylation domain-containing protein
MPFARRLITAVRRPQPSGFTLLEVCVVLFIVAVIFVVAAVPATHLFNEEKLLAPVRALQGCAKAARLRAMTGHQTCVILFGDDGYELAVSDPVTAHATVVRGYRLPPDVELLCQAPADKEYRRVADVHWYFAPNGLCEPMKFLLQQGKSWVRFRIDPLTARVQDQESFID